MYQQYHMKHVYFSFSIGEAAAGVGSEHRFHNQEIEYSNLLVQTELEQT